MKILLFTLLLTSLFCPASFSRNPNEINSFAYDLDSYLQQQKIGVFQGLSWLSNKIKSSWIKLMATLLNLNRLLPFG
jgi:hypothetical protein